MFKIVYFKDIYCFKISQEVIKILYNQNLLDEYFRGFLYKQFNLYLFMKK